MNDEVLSYIKRGHTKNDTLKAIHLLNDSEIPFVGQMMVGLPNATAEDEIFCAEQICALGAAGARIYPTLVFKNTELEHLTHSGAYLPLSLEDAVARSATVLEVFFKNNVPCIRIGLCDSENLHSDDTFIAGPSSPSIGEMVKSRMYYNKIFQMLKNSRDYFGCSLIIECGKGYVSQVVGNKRKNIVEIKNRFGIKSISVRENSGLDFMELKIEVKEENSCD
jgi:histone acetyltransferase (RNA polymerase elongator complex component)